MANGRLWLFRIGLMVAGPALLLVSLEAGLRALGSGYTTDFTQECEVDGSAAFCENGKFSRLFFSPAQAREPRSFVLPAEKAPRTFRIFVFGGSAAEGDPDPSYGFSRILEVMLRARYPEVRFEVVNMGMTAINSHVVLRITRSVARHEADLFIVYLGNNEVVGPFGAGTVFSPLSSSLFFIRATIFAKSTRTGQLLEKVLNLGGGGKETRGKWMGMEMFLDHQVRGDDPGMEKVYGHFRSNLEDMIHTARKAGAQTILSTVGTNIRDTAPFSSLHRPDMNEVEKGTWESRYASGIQAE